MDFVHIPMDSRLKPLPLGLGFGGVVVKNMKPFFYVESEYFHFYYRKDAMSLRI
jgi:hypothetical protein